VDIDVRRCGTVEELQGGLNVVSHYFGHENRLEDAERFAQWIEIERMHVARIDGRIVGGAGAFGWELTIPGATVRAAGITVVGVLPTHRRRGVLTAMMKEQLEDCRRRGDLVAHLFASEGAIYGRFGYGLAARMGDATIAKERTAFAEPFEPRGTVRLVDHEESVRVIPSLYDEVRRRRPGMFSRNEPWWTTRRLHDDPARRRAGPLNRALLELDGAAAGYALYRVNQDWVGGSSAGHVIVTEALATSPAATRELWRWLLDFDWTSEFRASMLPLDHALFLLLAEPRRMQFRINDGQWVRLVDVEQALSARTYRRGGEVVLDVVDPFLPENAGRYRVTGDGPSERTRRPKSGSTSPRSAPSTSAASASATSTRHRASKSCATEQWRAPTNCSRPASRRGARRSSDRSAARTRGGAHALDPRGDRGAVVVRGARAAPVAQERQRRVARIGRPGLGRDLVAALAPHRKSLTPPARRERRGGAGGPLLSVRGFRPRRWHSHTWGVPPWRDGLTASACV
jgi:predicted acetyltransferase